MQTIQQMLDQNGRPPLEVTLDWLAQVQGAITSRNQAEGSAPASHCPSVSDLLSDKNWNGWLFDEYGVLAISSAPTHELLRAAEDWAGWIVADLKVLPVPQAPTGEDVSDAQTNCDAAFAQEATIAVSESNASVVILDEAVVSQPLAKKTTRTLTSARNPSIAQYAQYAIGHALRMPRAMLVIVLLIVIGSGVIAFMITSHELQSRRVSVSSSAANAPNEDASPLLVNGSDGSFEMELPLLDLSKVASTQLNASLSSLEADLSIGSPQPRSDSLQTNPSMMLSELGKPSTLSSACPRLLSQTPKLNFNSQNIANQNIARPSI